MGDRKIPVHSLRDRPIRQPNKKTPRAELGELKKIPAITYFRACEHYHRPCELNDRVRNGNECDLAGLVTGKPACGRCPASQAVDRSVWHAGPKPDLPVMSHFLKDRNQRGQVFPR